MKTNHITVLLEEAVKALQVKPGYWYIDATFGGGGHTELILSKGGKVVAFDFDQNAIAMGKEKFETALSDKTLLLIQANFLDLQDKLKAHSETIDLTKIDGVLFDFGTSTDQLMNEERGFSFAGEGELDMRMDQTLGVKAKDLLALLSEKQLTETFFNYGGELEAKKIAKAIVENRKKCIFVTTNKDLATLVEKVKKSRNKTHPATKVFQALRIVVNDELTNIEDSLPQAFEVVRSGGRIVTISFHEGEDKIVKSTFKNWHQNNQGMMITQKPITPSDTAVAENPRSRSAKMRIFEK
jgi:16S rRNA (cytosine1402-N4)-methyltransferase